MVIRVCIVDFWDSYLNDISAHPILAYFFTSPKFKIVTTHEECDLILASVFYTTHTKFNPAIKKIIYSAENVKIGCCYPRRIAFDNANVLWLTNLVEDITLDPGVKYYYLPYGMIHWDVDGVISSHHSTKKKERHKFCCFVSSDNGNLEGWKLRCDFFQYLCDNYKRVDAGGKINNNLGYYVPREENKYIEWVSDYKFMLCFENSRGSGYLTEKIFTAYAAGSIPIYWGDKSNLNFINERACIIYTTPEETLERIKEVDTNETLRQAMLDEDLLLPAYKFLFERSRLTRILDETITDLFRE